MDTVTRVQILDETNCISHSTNTIGKGMNPIILLPAMGKQQGILGSSALVRQLVQEKENSELKPVKLRLKIDLVSYPARAEGLGKYDKILLDSEKQTDDVIQAKRADLVLINKNLLFSGFCHPGIPQSSSITGTTPSDYLVSIQDTHWGGSNLSAEMQSLYSKTPADWEICVRIRISTILCKLKNLSNENDIQICWVPSHTGISGNHQADKAARFNINLTTEKKFKIPYSDFKMKINKYEVHTISFQTFQYRH